MSGSHGLQPPGRKAEPALTRLFLPIFDSLTRIENFLAKHADWILSILLFLYVCVSVLRALSLRFWYDELLTLYLGRSGSVADLVHALRDGFDQVPLGFHLLIRPFAQANEWPHVIARIPSIAGFGVMMLGLWVFARRRLPPASALLAFLLPCLTHAVDYTTEARPYALVLGFAALAMVCWQAACERQPRTLWLIGLWASLAIAISCHYYAVLLLAPIGAGELVRWIQRRRLDIPVVLATLASLLVLLPLWPFIQAARGFSAYFWSLPAWDRVSLFYTSLVHIWTIVAAILGAVLIAAVSILGRRIAGERASSKEPSGFRPHEWAAIATLVLLPLLGTALAMFVTHAYTERYVLPALLGIALTVAGLVAKCTRRTPAGALLPAGILIAAGLIAPLFTAGARAMQPGSPPPRFGHPNVVEEAARAGTLPIAYMDGVGFLELHHYETPEIAARLVYIADPDLDVQYTGSDSVDRELAGLAKYVSLGVAPLEPFLAKHLQFLLVTSGGGWLQRELLARRYELTPVPGDSEAFLVRSTSPPRLISDASTK